MIHIANIQKGNTANAYRSEYKVEYKTQKHKKNFYYKFSL